MAGWTVERFAEHWLDPCRRASAASATVSSYRETLRLHIVPMLGRVSCRR